jgi:hypothetical protein
VCSVYQPESPGICAAGIITVVGPCSAAT